MESWVIYTVYSQPYVKKAVHKNTDWKEADNTSNSGYSTEKDESRVGLFLYSSLHFLHFLN